MAKSRNDGIWTGSWQTPANLPSDWVVDVIVFDKAVSPFGAGANNWKIYDNVWGFTTRPFQVDPRTTLLYVNDYDQGQKFFAYPRLEPLPVSVCPYGRPHRNTDRKLDDRI